MSECKHSWKQIEAKDGGVIECAGCHERWRGPAAEFVWRRANDAIGELNRRLDKVTEAFDKYLRMWSCDTCGAYFPQQEGKGGLNIDDALVCYDCAPEWLEKVGDRYADEHERRYARVRLARWLCANMHERTHLRNVAGIRSGNHHGSKGRRQSGVRDQLILQLLLEGAAAPVTSD